MVFVVLTERAIDRYHYDMAMEDMVSQNDEVVAIIEDYNESVSLLKDSLENLWLDDAREYGALIEGLLNKYGQSAERRDQSIDLMGQLNQGSTKGLGVYSKKEGMLLYPYGQITVSTCLFNDQNQEVLNKAWTQGESYARIACKTPNGNVDHFAYFSYYEPLDWMIILLEPVEKESADYFAEMSIEQNDILDRFQSMHNGTFVDVMDGFMFVEYTNHDNIIGEKISGFDELSQAEVSVALQKLGAGRVNLRLPNQPAERAYQLGVLTHVEALDKYVLVAMPEGNVVDGTTAIKWAVRIMALFLFVVLTRILIALYENFIIFVDPLAESPDQSGLIQQIRRLGYGYVSVLLLTVLLSTALGQQVVDITLYQQWQEDMINKSIQLERLLIARDRAVQDLERLKNEAIDRRLRAEAQSMEGVVRWAGVEEAGSYLPGGVKVFDDHLGAYQINMRYNVLLKRPYAEEQFYDFEEGGRHYRVYIHWIEDLESFIVVQSNVTLSYERADKLEAQLHERFELRIDSILKQYVLYSSIPYEYRSQRDHSILDQGLASLHHQWGLEDPIEPTFFHYDGEDGQSYGAVFYRNPVRKVEMLLMGQEDLVAEDADYQFAMAMGIYLLLVLIFAVNVMQNSKRK